jgi:cytoplasmic tRNA 2-thiolation protein 2
MIEEEKKLDEIQHSTPTNLESVLNKEVQVSDIEGKRKRIIEILECLPSISNFREDLILYFKRWIIVDFALTFNFKKILFGTTGHKVASQLLSQLAKGRGASIAHEISYIDDKNFNGRVTFMNPMREFL